MFYQNEIENTFNLTTQEEESFESLRFRELRDIIEEGYPTFTEIREFETFKDRFDYQEEPSHTQQTPDTFSDERSHLEMITRIEHTDRPNDDRLNKPYDGETLNFSKYYSIGKSISFSTPNFRWIKYPSPFNGYKEYNANIYKHCSEAIDSHSWAKISGFKGKRMTNYLQVWLECPEWIKNKPDLAKHLTCFLFGQIVQDYREKVIQMNPQHFKRDRDPVDFLNI